MMGGKKVTPIRGSEPPGSAVVPVARKISSTAVVSPIVLLERLALSRTETALQALRDSARAKGEGDKHAAALFREVAERALDDARLATDALGNTADL